MFTRKTLLTIIATGAVVGGAMQLLHAAETKGSSYVVGMINVKDEESYKTKFLPDAQKVIKDHGGVYLAGGFNKTVALTGAAPPNRVVIFKFEGADGAKKWWEGGGKKINDEVGVKYADFHVLAVEGIEAQ